MKLGNWIVFCLACVATALAGCSQPLVRTSPPATTPDKRDTPPASLATANNANAVALLKYAEAFGAMPAESQKREFTDISARRRTEFTRMQLALMAALPASRYRDLARAQALLDEHLKAPDSRDEGLRALAVLIKTLLNSQQKQEDTLMQLSQKLKDEQRRSEMLQQKLDELMAIEKTLNERRQAVPR